MGGLGPNSTQIINFAYSSPTVAPVLRSGKLSLTQLSMSWTPITQQIETGYNPIQSYHIYMREANSQTYNHAHTAKSPDFNKYLYHYTEKVALNTKAFFKIKA